MHLNGIWMASDCLLSTCLTFVKTLDTVGLGIHICKVFDTEMKLKLKCEEPCLLLWPHLVWSSKCF